MSSSLHKSCSSMKFYVCRVAESLCLISFSLLSLFSLLLPIIQYFSASLNFSIFQFSTLHHRRLPSSPYVPGKMINYLTILPNHRPNTKKNITLCTTSQQNMPRSVTWLNEYKCENSALWLSKK